MKVWTNLTGTTADQFAIGKQGVVILQGTDAPSNGLGSNGNFYFRHGPTPGIFQKKDGSWRAVNDALAKRQVIARGTAGTIDDDTSYLAVGPGAGAPTSVTLPSPSTGRQVTIKDETGSASSHPVTVSGGLIDGAASYVVNANFGSVTLACADGAWFVVRRS